MSVLDSSAIEEDDDVIALRIILCVLSNWISYRYACIGTVQ